MYATIREMTPPDPDFPTRVHRLGVLKRILNGTFYDVLPYEFHQERTDSGEYIPLRQRRPSVRYALPRIVVEDSVALLFSDGHFPDIDSPCRDTAEGLSTITRSVGLNSIMTDAALRGSIGSVAILLRLLRGRVFLDVLETLYLQPEWEGDAPDKLRRVTERYKVAGSDLVTQGYSIPDPAQEYWFVRSWDSVWETWYEPVLVGSTISAGVDAGRTIQHGLGFVPITWIRNLPGGQGIDGACTFEAAIDTSIEIDYQLSQAGRGLKYSSDPTLLIREPAGFDGTMVRGAANALVVSEKGDAKLLEIGGTASQAVMDYVRMLRELALENVHGNRADPSRLTVPASGRALELMNQGLLWLVDNLRVSYGQFGLLGVLRMILRAGSLRSLHVEGRALPAMDPQAPISLRWPDWYPADALDRQRDAETVGTMVTGGLISRETGIRILAPTYDIESVAAEIKRLKGELVG